MFILVNIKREYTIRCGNRTTKGCQMAHFKLIFNQATQEGKLKSATIT